MPAASVSAIQRTSSRWPCRWPVHTARISRFECVLAKQRTGFAIWIILLRAASSSDAFEALGQFTHADLRQAITAAGRDGSLRQSSRQIHWRSKLRAELTSTVQRPPRGSDLRGLPRNQYYVRAIPWDNESRVGARAGGFDFEVGHIIGELAQALSTTCLQTSLFTRQRKRSANSLADISPPDSSVVRANRSSDEIPPRSFLP